MRDKEAKARRGGVRKISRTGERNRESISRRELANRDNNMCNLGVWIFLSTQVRFYS